MLNNRTHDFQCKENMYITYYMYERITDKRYHSIYIKNIS